MGRGLNNRTFVAILDSIVKKYGLVDKRILVTEGFSPKMVSLLLLLYNENRDKFRS